MVFGSGVTRVANARIYRVNSNKVAKRPGTNDDGLSSANRMLLTQTRRFATAASVRIVSMYCSASPDSPFAWRSTTPVWRKCLSLLDVIKTVVLLCKRRQIERTPNVDRCRNVSSFLDADHFYSLRKLTVASVYCSSGYANVFVAERVQRIF